MKIKTYIFLLVSFLMICANYCEAQSSMEAYVTPGLGYRQMSVKQGTPMSYRDSLNKMDHVRQNWGGGFSYVHEISHDNKVQISFFYKRSSYLGRLENLQFQDTVHPSVGRITDLSQTVLQKDALFVHQYHYLCIPILFHSFIGPDYGKAKMAIHVVSGLSFNMLINDDVPVFLKGFTVGGKSHHLISNDYNSTKMNLDLVLGGRVRFKIGEKSYFFTQPYFSFPFLRTAEDERVSLRVFQVNLQTGVGWEI
ncbi:MAG: hypothetical protein GC181_06665 [Bacteroidetes bacterium]|nr:hypothetical protein [Bacteroidota bacterium]